MTTPAPRGPLRLFYSYAHADDTLRNELDNHLISLRYEGYIAPWYDRDITAGEEWEYTIDEHLNAAHIILLLISKNFLASRYCYSVEMRRALERHEAGEAIVIPVILGFCDWQYSPFSKLQVLPTDGKPVVSENWYDRDEAFTIVAQGIRLAMKTRFPGFAPVYQPSHSTLPTQRHSQHIDTIQAIPYRRNPFFTGRETLLEQVREKLTHTGATALTQPQAISGLGGIGKTQTAIEYAYRYRSDYRYVFWVNAATSDTILSSFAAIATLLHLTERDEQDLNQVADAVRSWLATYDGYLLILDNADDIPLVDEFLPIESKGHILLTTRARFTGTTTDLIEVEKMDQQEAILLLLRRARLVGRDVSLDSVKPADKAEAEAIVVELDGLPLAIDQAGAYIEETRCNLSDYLKLYRLHRKDLLRRRSGRRAMHPASDHPEPIAATLLLSFQKVEQTHAAAADLLRLYAFLAPDAIPEEIVTEGASELGLSLQSLADAHAFNEAIVELSKYSLVKREADKKLLSVHRLVQAVIRDEMNDELRQQWAESAVRAVNRSFPLDEEVPRFRSQRYLPHALTCTDLIDRRSRVLPEVAQLFQKAGIYLSEQQEDMEPQYEEPEALFHTALTIQEQMLGVNHPETALTLNYLAILSRDQGRYERAESLFQRALAIREQVLGADHLETAQSFHSLAVLYRDWGKYDEAEQLFQRALPIYERVEGDNGPRKANLLNNFALLYYFQRKYKLAESLFLRALTIYEQTMGVDHPYTTNTLSNLANLYRDRYKFKQAWPLYQRVLAIRKQKLGDDHPDTAQILNNLATFYRFQHKYEQAESLYLHALAIRERTLGAFHKQTAQTLNNLASLYRDQGKYEQAETLYRRSLDIYERKLGADHPSNANTLNNLATLYEAQNKYEQAGPLYQRALDIYERKLGPENLSTIKTREKLERLLHKRQQ